MSQEQSTTRCDVSGRALRIDCTRALRVLWCRLGWMAGYLLWAGAAVLGQTRIPPRVAASLDFRSQVEVPEAGLRLPAPSGAEAEGLRPAPVQSYRDASGRIVQMQSPRDYWVSSQFLGRWRITDRFRMTLVSPQCLLPREWPRPHVQPSEYAAATAGLAPPGSPEEWRLWGEMWAGRSPTGPPHALPATVRLSEVLWFTWPGDDLVRCAVAFRFRPNVHGVDPQRWFLVLFEASGDVEKEVLEREILQRFVPGVATITKAGAPPVRGGDDRSSVPGSGGADGALELSRQRAIQSIRGQSGWWYLESPHFVVVSDVTGTRANLVRRVHEDMEPLRAAFAVLIPPRVPVRAVNVVRIFANGVDYVRWVGEAHAWSGGLWSPKQGELVIRAMEGGSPRAQREWLADVIYHEAFHQYLFYATGGRMPGVWFNEGHAAFFEGAEIRGGVVTIEEVPKYVGRVDRLVREGRLQMARVLALTYPEMYGPASADDRADNYARCWVLVYFLRKHAEAVQDHPWANFADIYFDALFESGNHEASVRRALDGKTPDQLQQAIAEFWRSNRARLNARRYDPFARRR